MKSFAATWIACICTAYAACVAGDKGILPDYTGFIRVQGGKFVDADCNQFPVTGLNACVSSSSQLVAAVIRAISSRWFVPTYLRASTLISGTFRKEGVIRGVDC